MSVAHGALRALVAALIVVPTVDVGPAHAQQRGGLEILALPVGARAVGLGEAMTAARGGLELLAYNPAGVGAVDAPAVHVSLMRAPDLLQGHVLALGAPVDGVAFLAASLRLVTLEPIPLRDEQGGDSGEFSPQAVTVGLSAARALPAGFDAGLTLKFTSVDLASGAASTAVEGGGRGTGFAVDLGAVWRPGPALPIALGASILDLGSSIAIGATADPLPTRLRAGVALDAVRLVRSAESPVSALLLVDREQDLADGRGGGFHFGVEARVLDLLALRGGLAPAIRDGGGRQPRFGIGVLHRRVGVEFAYELSESPALDDRTHLSIGFRF